MPWTKVYTEKEDFENTLAKEGLRGITYRQAIKEAQEQMFLKDKDVFILGEGVDDPGGIFGTTLGLCERFGKDRVMDIPIAENGLTGIALGSAMAGMKPIFVHMRMDFLPMCMDQIINHAAKWHYMTGGKVNVPIVIRSIIGRGWGSAAQHSQALHSLFTLIPGLKVIMPATPYDAKGLLISAINDGNPVMFVEHRWVYDYIGYVPEEIYQVPIGQGIIRRQGSDITVVAISQMQYESIKAAKQLEADGIDIEIIDPRTLNPLDEDLILNSIKKTGRLIIADVCCKSASIGSEIAARLLEKGHNLLKAPIERICFPDTPTPASCVLEKAYYPSKDEIIGAAKRVMGKAAKISQNGKIEISVVMPALNEQKNIEAAIKNTAKALTDYGINGEIIVVNDGSSDNTAEIVNNLIKSDKRVKMLDHDSPKGIGASFWDGVDAAKGDAIVMLPGDNENDPLEILRYYNFLEHVDIVIPFIFNKEARSIIRNSLSFVYRFIINTTFLVNFNYTNGTILYRKSILKELDYRSYGFFFQTDILIRIAKKGYLFAEVPYRINVREHGVSKAVSFPSLLRVMRGYMRLVKDFYCRKIDKNSGSFSENSLTALRRGNKR